MEFILIILGFKMNIMDLIKIGIENFELNYNFNPKDIYRGLFNKKLAGLFLNRFY